MSVIIKNKIISITDRTIMEIIKRHKNINQNVIRKFVILLKGIGIDLIEINKETLDMVKNLPEDLDYIYKVNDISNICFINKYKYNFKYIVIDYKEALVLDSNCLDKLKYRDIILEIDVKVLDNIFLPISNKIFEKLNIRCLRIKHIVKYNLLGWSNLIDRIRKSFFVDIDFCADNKFYMATAISLEGCMDGVDFITAAFNGEKYKLASLEEIILELKVIKEAQISGDLKLIGKLKKVYEELTGENIECMKPVIGQDIFKYESGIHVDGIAKNPNTYEPYNPCDVNDKRTMYIGKHSGKKSIMVKLQELNLDYKNIDMSQFLSKVRETSIELRRNILDDELIKIYNDFNNSCLK